MNQARLFAKVLVLAALLHWGLAAVACQGQPSSESAGVENLISDIPRCEGMEQVQALEFDWPDIENVREKLADYYWGYYRCDVTQPELSLYYRTNMSQPPFLWREVNHAERKDGMVVLFYHPVKVTWNYLWMLPGPDARSSYLVVSRSGPGEPQAWECRLSSPDIPMRASKGR